MRATRTFGSLREECKRLSLAPAWRAGSGNWRPASQELWKQAASAWLLLFTAPPGASSRWLLWWARIRISAGIFPVPVGPGAAAAISPDAVLYDVSDREQVEVTDLPAEVEINRHRAIIEREIQGEGA